MNGHQFKATHLDIAAGITGIHPVAELFPPLTTDQFAALTVDIEHHGQLTPIILTSDGRIINGVHRRLACIQLHREPRVVRTEANPADIALSLNLNVRSLTESQRAMIGVELYAAAHNYPHPTEFDVAELADTVGVDYRQVELAKYLMADQRDRQTQYYPRQVRAGRLSLHKAVQLLRQEQRPLGRVAPAQTVVSVHVPGAAGVAHSDSPERSPDKYELEAVRFEHADAVADAHRLLDNPDLSLQESEYLASKALAILPADSFATTLLMAQVSRMQL